MIRPCLYGAFHFIWPAKVGENFVPKKRVNGLEMDNTDMVDGDQFRIIRRRQAYEDLIELEKQETVSIRIYTGNEN